MCSENGTFDFRKVNATIIKFSEVYLGPTMA